MANLVGVPDCLYGSHRVSCVHEFSGCELLSWKTLRKLPPNGIFSNRLLPAEMEDEPNNSNGYETESNERRFHNRGGRSTTQAQRAGPREAWIATVRRWPGSLQRIRPLCAHARGLRDTTTDKQRTTNAPAEAAALAHTDESS